MKRMSLIIYKHAMIERGKAEQDSRGRYWHWMNYIDEVYAKAVNIASGGDLAGSFVSI